MIWDDRSEIERRQDEQMSKTNEQLTARLTTAVGLLYEVRSDPRQQRESWWRKVDAFLASAQPAAPERLEPAPGFDAEHSAQIRERMVRHAAPASTEAERIRVIVNGRISWHTPERLDGILTAILDSTRTEAEQAVLAAAKAWFDGWQEQHGHCYLLAPHPAQDAALWAAELALRGVK